MISTRIGTNPKRSWLVRQADSGRNPREVEDLGIHRKGPLDRLVLLDLDDLKLRLVGPLVAAVVHGGTTTLACLGSTYTELIGARLPL